MDDDLLVAVATVSCAAVPGDYEVRFGSPLGNENASKIDQLWGSFQGRPPMQRSGRPVRVVGARRLPDPGHQVGCDREAVRSDGQEVVENWNSANTGLHCGKDRALSGPDKEHAETSMLALHLPSPPWCTSTPCCCSRPSPNRPGRRSCPTRTGED